MIIAGHAITHTDIYNNVGGINFYFVKFFDIIFNVATNVYVVISGYLLCEKTFKIKKVFNLWFQILFYSVIIYLVLIITNQIDFSLTSLVKVLMPISGNQYWFARVYLGLYILSPFLNILIKTGLPLLLGAVILYWIYGNFDFARIWEALHTMDMWWFWVSCLFGVLSHAIRGWRWRLTLAPLGYRPANDSCVYSIFIAYAANLVVPRVGEVSRCVVLERYDRVPFAQSLGTLVSERLVDTAMVLLITLVAVASQWTVFRAFVAEAGGVSESGIFSSVGRMVILLLSLVAVGAVLYFLVRRLSLWGRVKSFVSRFCEGFMSLTKMRHFWLFIIETVGIWLCYFLQFYLCFFCFDFSSGLSVAAALLLFVAGSVAVVVPTPNGAGPWHFAVMSIMMLYGVSSTDAGAFALIVHSLQTLLVALLGIVGLVMLQFKR